MAIFTSGLLSNFRIITRKPTLKFRIYLLGLDQDTSVYPPNMWLPTLIIVTVGPFPSQLLWKVDTDQPSVLARQHRTNLLRDELWRTEPKNEFNLTRYLASRSPRILDEHRAPKTKLERNSSYYFSSHHNKVRMINLNPGNNDTKIAIENRNLQCSECRSRKI